MIRVNEGGGDNNNNITSAIICIAINQKLIFNEGTWKICFNLQFAYQIMNRYKSALFSFILLR